MADCKKESQVTFKSGYIVLSTSTPTLVFGPVEKEVVLSIYTGSGQQVLLGDSSITNSADSWLLDGGQTQTHVLGRGDEVYALAGSTGNAIRFLAIGD
jgi:hypothetical protein